MKVCVLASGSKGNCVFINVGTHNILIDAGISIKELTLKLNNIAVDIKDIDTILITHAHIDHVGCLDRIYNKTKANIYMTIDIYSEIKNNIREKIEFIELKPNFYIDDIHIIDFKTSHDTRDSKGYVIEYNNKSFVYVTDTGYINKKYYQLLTDRNIYIFESNHDPVMLMNGAKPLDRKNRVLSDSGHLSNNDSGRYLSELIGDNTKFVVLAHLSEKDNTPDKAYNTVNEWLIKKNKKTNLLLSNQHQATDLLEV